MSDTPKSEPTVKPLFDLDALLDKTPEAFRPVVIQYGPQLATWTIEDFWAWVALLVSGKNREAWHRLYSNTTTAEFLESGQTISDAWETANVKNANRISIMEQARDAILKILLAVTLSLVGL